MSKGGNYPLFFTLQMRILANGEPEGADSIKLAGKKGLHGQRVVKFVVVVVLQGRGNSINQNNF